METEKEQIRNRKVACDRLGLGFFFFTNNTCNKQVLVTLLELQLARIILRPCQAVGAFMRPGWRARTFPCGPTRGVLQEEGI